MKSVKEIRRFFIFYLFIFFDKSMFKGIGLGHLAIDACFDYWLILRHRFLTAFVLHMTGTITSQPQFWSFFIHSPVTSPPHLHSQRTCRFRPLFSSSGTLRFIFLSLIFNRSKLIYLCILSWVERVQFYSFTRFNGMLEVISCCFYIWNVKFTNDISESFAKVMVFLILG